MGGVSCGLCQDEAGRVLIMLVLRKVEPEVTAMLTVASDPSRRR